MKKNIFICLILAIFSINIANAMEFSSSEKNLYQENFFNNAGTITPEQKIEIIGAKNSEILKKNIKIITENNDEKSLIPQKSEIFKTLEKKYGSEKIISKIYQVHDDENKIRYFGVNINCPKNDEKVGGAQDRGNCLIGKAPELYTNSEINKSISFEIEDDKEIIIKLYPISPDIYGFQDYSQYEQGKISKLTIFDTIFEYYNLAGNLSNVSNQKAIQSVNFVKKYEIITFNSKLKGLYTEEEKGKKHKMIVPYYEAKIKTEKGKYNLNIDYNYYIPKDFSGNFIINEKTSLK